MVHSKPPHIPTQGKLGNAAYNVAHFSTAYLNVPPNLHRLRSAIGLTIGLYAGRRLMEIVTGSTIEGKEVKRDDLPPALRPLHGLIAYDHFSDDPKDRWMKVLDMCVPAVLGGVGASLGSVNFFKKSFLEPVELGMKLPAGKYCLGHAEREALDHLSRPASLMAAHAQGYGSSSGFGLLPSWLNFSSTLGALFTLRAQRQPVVPWLGKELSKKLFNTHSSEPWRPTKLVDRMIDQLVGNPNLTRESFNDTAEGMLRTWFRRVTPKQIEYFKTSMLRSAESLKHNPVGNTPEQMIEDVRKELQRFLNVDEQNFETQLVYSGIDPREAAIGDVGLLSTLSRWGGDLLGFKTTENLKATQAKLIKGLEERHGKAALDALHPKDQPFVPPDLTQSSTAAKVVAGTLSGTGLASLYAITTARDRGIADLNPSTEPAAPHTKRHADKPGKHRHIVHSKKQHGFVNGKLLDTSEGITGMFSAAIGLHRVHCAVGLTVGSWLGDKFMEAVTGRSFNGHNIPVEEIWRPLRKVYKTLPFSPHSNLPNDKWVQVVRWGVPAAVGTIAVMQGSKLFFEERRQKLKGAKYLDEVDDKATFAQSQPWSYTAAVSGLFGFPSGLPMLPLVNYSTSLGMRFSMGSGRKVSLPIMGKIWSNNDTLFPFGPPGMLQLLIREAVNNKARDPELLETYAIGILKPWFENVTPDQIEAFVMKVHEVRDHYLREGGVPEDLKKALESELKLHFQGAGLEHTLEEVGLDPLNAAIASNGLSGKIANILGAGGNVRKIKSEYTKGYRERMEKHQDDRPPHGITI